MSALIWVAIVAVWGFVLIPMWLRRHDTLSEQRSTERFTVAMRVLSRRPPVDDEAMADMDPGGVGGTGMSHGQPSQGESERAGGAPAGPASAGSAPGAPIASTGPRTPRPLGARPAPDFRHDLRPESRAESRSKSRAEPRAESRPEPRRTAAAASGANRRVSAERAALMRVRRQRLTIMVVLFPLTVLLAAVFGGLWIAVQVLADLGVAAYLVHLRRAAQVERRLEVTRAAIERRIEAERVARGRRRPVGSAFAYHERDAAGLSDTQEGLTPEELAHAQAETIDLGALMAGHGNVPAGHGYPAAHDSGAGGGAGGSHALVVPAHGALGSDHVIEADQAAGAGYVAAAGHPAGAGYATEAGHPADGDYVIEGDYAAEAGAAEAASPRTSSRPVARPPARPTTSRPGRVQINPPGTHGGLTAPPQAEPAPTTPDHGDTSGELDDPLLRRAVGS